MQGLTYLEASILPSGFPEWEVRGTDAMGEFEAEMFVDYAAEALERAREENGGKHPKGTQFRVKRAPKKD